MAENIYIDLTEEIESDLLTRYQGLCDELTQNLNSMFQELEELCGQTLYEPMLNVVNQTIELFNEDIYSIATQIFEEWTDGEGSFSAVSANSQAGDAALETARNIESGIKDIFDTFWNSHPLGEGIQVDTSRPKIKSEDFNELKDIYTKCSQEIDSIGEDTVNQIVQAGSDDPIYNVIIPAMLAITKPVKEAFEQFVVKVDEAREESEMLKQRQDSKNEEATEMATNTSASAQEIADALAMFSDI
ncbi:hypothetical protein [Blautia sp.]|uniref:hypothetical protein n=1 Tax=Blautia sp. TaxID=1955243 RepID=UPI00260C8CA3|nr:hypothetical protein [Blautia sp.]